MRDESASSASLRIGRDFNLRKAAILLPLHSEDFSRMSNHSVSVVLATLANRACWAALAPFE